MSEWTVEADIDDSGITHFQLVADGRAVSRHDFLTALTRSAPCREALTTALRALPVEQIYWESPPLTTATSSQPAEFVAVPTGLSRPADPSAFEAFFTPGDLVATFPNLRGDAVLVAPTAHDPDTNYNYLLSFLRTGTAAQIEALWVAVGRAALAELSDEPRWLSTSGGGVPWLHVRLDSTPKYYSHALYRRAPDRRDGQGAGKGIRPGGDHDDR